MYKYLQSINKESINKESINKESINKESINFFIIFLSLVISNIQNFHLE